MDCELYRASIIIWGIAESLSTLYTGLVGSVRTATSLGKVTILDCCCYLEIARALTRM